MSKNFLGYLKSQCLVWMMVFEMRMLLWMKRWTSGSGLGGDGSSLGGDANSKEMVDFQFRHLQSFLGDSGWSCLIGYGKSRPRSDKRGARLAPWLCVRMYKQAWLLLCVCTVGMEIPCVCWAALKTWLWESFPFPDPSYLVGLWT